jgi:hypothetical protein
VTATNAPQPRKQGRPPRPPGDELVYLHFKMPKRFVKAFKQRALDEDLRLNALLRKLFEAAA